MTREVVLSPFCAKKSAVGDLFSCPPPPPPHVLFFFPSGRTTLRLPGQFLFFKKLGKCAVALSCPWHRSLSSCARCSFLPAPPPLDRRRFNGSPFFFFFFKKMIGIVLTKFEAVFMGLVFFFLLRQLLPCLPSFCTSFLDGDELPLTNQLAQSFALIPSSLLLCDRVRQGRERVFFSPPP